jgi:hypothetical protein
MDLTSKILKSSLALRVFSSEVGTGSREENASKQKRDRSLGSDSTRAEKALE